ncbi:MAG: hypothetical protein DI628_04545 [Blastochloris viridis]|uniref:Uncharacterized protein n=1 Tax=Blastochloris viridis TaxID=1079 RepID=A0A6N4RFL7_BLAVI|nr:MAG: hypothetical protein DI628_04545 [Blastochloris viridis]
MGYVPPTLRRVTSDAPYQGAYLEDDMTPATLPDGTPLHTYMIDGYAIDTLWLGFDKAACRTYVDSLPDDSPHLLPMHAFTQELADLASPLFDTPLRTDIYEYLVVYKEHFVALTQLDFKRMFVPKRNVSGFTRTHRSRAA